MCFAERLNECINENNISLGKLAKKTGLSISSLSRYINNERKPKEEKIIILAYALNINPGYLDGSSDDKYISKDMINLMVTIKNHEKRISDKNQSEFSKRLKLLLEFTNTQQKELANVLNISTSRISNYINDKRQPDIDIIVDIAKYFNVSTDFLLGVSFKNILQDNILEENIIKSKDYLKFNEFIVQNKYLDKYSEDFIQNLLLTLDKNELYKLIRKNKKINKLFFEMFDKLCDLLNSIYKTLL